MLQSQRRAGPEASCLENPESVTSPFRAEPAEDNTTKRLITKPTLAKKFGR